MNCNCKSEYEARLAEVLSEMNPTHRGMKVEIDGYTISISVGEVKTGMTAVVKYESEQQNKSGESGLPCIRASRFFHVHSTKNQQRRTHEYI